MIREAILIVSNIAHDIARDLRDHLAINHCMVAILLEKGCLSAPLTRNDDLVGGA